MYQLGRKSGSKVLRQHNSAPVKPTPPIDLTALFSPSPPRTYEVVPVLMRNEELRQTNIDGHFEGEEANHSSQRVEIALTTRTARVAAPLSKMYKSLSFVAEEREVSGGRKVLMLNVRPPS